MDKGRVSSTAGPSRFPNVTLSDDTSIVARILEHDFQGGPGVRFLQLTLGLVRPITIWRLLSPPKNTVLVPRQYERLQG